MTLSPLAPVHCRSCATTDFGMAATGSGSIVGCVPDSAPPVDCPMPVASGMGAEPTVEPRA
eukprot:4225303-Prymnesium_polylepis.1